METYYDHHCCKKSKSVQHHHRVVEHQPNSSRPVERPTKRNPSSSPTSSHPTTRPEFTEGETQTVFVTPVSVPQPTTEPPVPACTEPLPQPLVIDRNTFELSDVPPKKGRRPGIVFMKSFDAFGVTHVEEIPLSQEPKCSIAEPDQGALARLEGRLTKMSISDGSLDMDCGCTEVLGRWLPKYLGYRRGRSIG